MRLIKRSLLVLFALALAAAAQSLQDFEKKVTEFTLANGMHFIVVERHNAPVVSFNTYVNAGSVDDPGGETGLAHMFEHMAFKGTTSIGTKNWPAEKLALAAIEQAYNRLDDERRKGPRADPKKIDALEKELKAAIDKAGGYVVPNEWDRIVEENGGVGMNAGTGEDSTNYYYNFPSNRLELWFYLESQRFLKPVFREFYKERDVVMEERRMRVESSPQGQLMEMLLATSFAAHPYRNMPGGWASDIENLRVGEAEAFYKKYYVPANITIGIAGDVNPVEVKRYAEKYFSLLPKRQPPSPVLTSEPNQDGEKQVQVDSPSQPLVFIGYKRPDQNDKDDPVFDVISDLLSGGRTGIMYKEMVRDKKISLAALSESTFPGGKYPNLFILFLVPSLGHTVDENEKACYDIIEGLKKEQVTPEELQRVKTKLRAGLIRRLDSNAGLAAQLTSYYVNYGDWRKLFTSLDDIDRVTAADVQRVARKYLVKEDRTVAYTVAPPKEGAK